MSPRKKGRSGTSAGKQGRAGGPARPVTTDGAPPGKARQPDPPPAEHTAPARRRPPRTPAPALRTREHAVPRTYHPVAATVAPPAPVPDPPHTQPARVRTPARNRAGEATRPRTPRAAFDALYARCAGALVRQVELLTGDREFARRAVVRAFDLAWQRWPEVACDRDPAGWVRAAAYEHALAPWARWLPARLGGRSRRRAAPADPVAAALLELPPARRRTVLLHDGLGLGLPQAAAEAEASTRAAAGRIALGRAELARALPDAPAEPEGAAEAAVPERLSALLDGAPEPPRPPAAVRDASERGVRRRTAGGYALTGCVALAALVTVLAGPGTGSRPAHRPDGSAPERGAAHGAPLTPYGGPAARQVRVPLSPVYVPDAGYTDGAGPHPRRVRTRAVEP